jgi:hypothetical protein
MNARIKTTGQLRQFLSDAILAVKNGDMTPDAASKITKLAGQINESFYAEVKVQQIAVAAGATANELGSLKIDGADMEKSNA